MEKELLRVITQIKEKTGIDVACTSENGLCYVNTRREYVEIPSGLFVGNEQIHQGGGLTLFKFNYSGAKFVGAILGDSEISKNYATLLTGYLEGKEQRSVELSYDEQFSLIVTGNSTKSRTLHFINRYSIPKTSLFVMVIKCSAGKSGDLYEFLKTYSSGISDAPVLVSADTCAFVKFIEIDEFAEYNSPVKQAEILARSLFEEAGMKVNVFVGGTVKSFSDVAVSYVQALSIEKMQEIFMPDAVVTAYKDFVLARILEDIPQAKVEEYLTALVGDGGDELLSDKELMSTGETFISSNLNVSETARELYIHRNTLNYRLDKIERYTGLDIRKFSDAVCFKMVATLSKLKG